MKKLKLHELKRDSVEQYKSKKKIDLVVVLDNIRSGMNVGSVFRTVDCIGASKIFLCGISPQPPHKEIFKTAIGAQDTVDWYYWEDISACISNLKAEGYSILGIEQTDKSIALSDTQVNRDDKIAIVMGNEVDGLSDSILLLLDQAIEIRQFGTKHSLNVSVCAGIVLWEMSRKLRVEKR